MFYEEKNRHRQGDQDRYSERRFDSQKEEKLYTPGWVRQLRVNPIPLLLQSTNPGIILDTYRYGYGLPSKYTEVEKAQRDVDRNPSTIRLLNIASGEDIKSSTEAESAYGLEFLESLTRMEKIIRAGINKHHKLIQPHVVKLMKFARDDGRFPLLYHHHAHACWVLLKLGLSGNRMLDKSIFWLLKRQRADGGWLHRSLVPDSQSFDETASCLWTTAEILQMIVLRKSLLQEIDYEKAVKFLLSNVEMDNTSILMQSKSYWNKLASGAGNEAMFSGGTLKVLEIAADFGVHKYDPAIDKYVKWLKNLQMDNGLFPMDAGKMSIADESVTVRVISVFRKFAKNERISDNSA
jgi:hypothetical protein